MTALAGAGCGDDDIASPPVEDATAPDAVVDGASGSDGGTSADAAPRDAAPRDAEAPDAATTDFLSILAGSSATGFADGTGDQARFSGPSGGAVLPDGSAILVADTFNAVLRRVDLPSPSVRSPAASRRRRPSTASAPRHVFNLPGR